MLVLKYEFQKSRKKGFYIRYINVLMVKLCRKIKNKVLHQLLEHGFLLNSQHKKKIHS